MRVGDSVSGQHSKVGRHLQEPESYCLGWPEAEGVGAWRRLFQSCELVLVGPWLAAVFLGFRPSGTDQLVEMLGLAGSPICPQLPSYLTVCGLGLPFPVSLGQLEPAVGERIKVRTNSGKRSYGPQSKTDCWVVKEFMENIFTANVVANLRAFLAEISLAHNFHPLDKAQHLKRIILVDAVRYCLPL